MNDKEAIGRMIFHAQRILRNISDIDYNQFSKDEPLVDLAILNIGHLGEQIKSISPELQQHHPEIPWAQIRSVRHRFFHSYSGIDYLMLWTMVHEDIPDLYPKLEAINRELTHNQPPERTHTHA